MSDTAVRRMPKTLDFGQLGNTVMASPMMNREDWIRSGRRSPHGLRAVMGYYLPTWQRGAVWMQAQQIAFIESAWRGVSLGTYTVNFVYETDHPLDNLLIDGQQRMMAIEAYITDAFPIFGWRWSEVTVVDRRFWEMSTAFSSYRMETTDEDKLRGYYDLLNFGGTPHTENQRAGRAPPPNRKG